jgi:hypothetical protein
MLPALLLCGGVIMVVDLKTLAFYLCGLWVRVAPSVSRNINFLTLRVAKYTTSEATTIQLQLLNSQPLNLMSYSPVNVILTEAILPL